MTGAGASARTSAPNEEDDDAPRACGHCGDTRTVELNYEDPGGREQGISVCATCGSDEP